MLSPIRFLTVALILCMPTFATRDIAEKRGRAHSVRESPRGSITLARLSTTAASPAGEPANSGQRGDGTRTNSATPVAVTGWTNVISLAVGGDHVAAVTALVNCERGAEVHITLALEQARPLAADRPKRAVTTGSCEC